MPTDLVLLLAALLVGAALALAGVAAARRRAPGRPRRSLDLPRAGAAGGGNHSVGTDELLRLTDAAGSGLLLIDGGGRIVLANEAAHRLLGWKKGSLRGRSTMEGFVDHRIEELLRRARSTGAAQLELTSVGEPQRTLVVRAERDSNGGVWLVLEDVSELRRLQRMRREFIDNLSHELRTPLTTVRLLTETLALELERSELPPRIRESILQIDVETGQLVQMVNELLDLAKIEQGEAHLQLEELDLGGVAERSLAGLQLYAERQAVALHAELPSDSAERTVRADEQRIRQLLTNLVHNAIKFSPAGGQVTLRLRPAPDEVVIEVEDRGVGIPRQELERIFERFYKVDRARSRDGGGTGLGLAIARHVAERHGGRIWAESDEGHGSRFLVALPRAGPSA